VWGCWRKHDPSALFADGLCSETGAEPVAGVAAREEHLASACSDYCAGLAAEKRDEVPTYPMPAGDPDQMDWISRSWWVLYGTEVLWYRGLMC